METINLKIRQATGDRPQAAEKPLGTSFFCRLSFAACRLLVICCLLPVAVSHAQAPRAGGDEAMVEQAVEPPAEPIMTEETLPEPTPIVIEDINADMEERLQRKITLDVRDMNVMDIIRFLALKGDFNLITSGSLQGRATFFLKSVAIKDALDIAVLSNNLAYTVEHNILRVMTEADYQAMYGKKFNDRNVVEIVRLNYAKPSYVLAALENVKSALGRLIIDEDTGSVVIIDTPESIKEMKAIIKQIEEPLVPVVFKMNYAKADVVAAKLKTMVEANKVGTISVDERTNSIVVRALPGRRKEIKKIVDMLDTPTKEVLVEARVLQVVFRPQMDFGIDWNLDFEDSDYQLLNRLNFQNVFMDEDTLSSSNNLFSNYGRLAVGDIDENQFELAIRALKQVSDTKILSNPKLLVTNNQEAKIHIGDTVPYIISTTSGTGDNAITSEDVRFVDVGLKLNVTPNISDNNWVTLVLQPEISTVTGSIESQGGGIPQVNKTLVETTVLVKDGMTVVLGGLKKENKVYTHKGVPLLMNVPVLGRLFSNKSESIESTEIVIFITPHIITGGEDWNKYRGTIQPDFDLNGEAARDKQDARPSVGLKLKE